MPTLASPSIIDTIADPNLFSRWFHGGSWNNWRVFLKGVFGHRMTKQDLQTFHEFTDRRTAPKETKEVWVVAGRRAGKSLISALAAVYLASFRDYSIYLAPGERATLMVVAADRRQARVVMRYIVAFLENVPMLKELIERQTQDSIDLANRVTIEVHTASSRSTRGYSIAAAVCDEIAFWRSEESANPDTEILGAIRPGMATIPGSMLFCISSPYARRGELWNAYRRYFGKEDRSVLVWQADSRSMNPNISRGFIQEAYERDPLGAMAEYGAQFRRDVESFVSLEAVEAVTIPGRLELPPTSHLGAALLEQAILVPSNARWTSLTMGAGGSEQSPGLGLRGAATDPRTTSL